VGERFVTVAIARLSHPLKVKGVVRATGHRRVVVSDTSRDREPRQGRERDRAAPKESAGGDLVAVFHVEQRLAGSVPGGRSSGNAEVSPAVRR
jgi:hypothetical protein